MHRFDYRFLEEMIPANIVSISNIICDLNARDVLRRQENQSVFQKLREAAIVESVKGSNAIEGIVTTGKRMKEILKENAAPQTHAEQEIFGYKNVLEEIYSEDFDADLSEELIQHFHYVMLQSISSEAGKYKKENNYIQERSADGRLSIRFVPTKAKDTPEAMNQHHLRML